MKRDRAVLRIDAHQHFWNPARGDYGWLAAELPICRPYYPADLEPHLSECGIGGTVLVQAAPTLQETEYLLGIADATPFVRGVVGWIDFEDPAQGRHLERLAVHPKFVGVRPMIQDLPDDGWMLREDISWAFDAIRRLDLVFDALVLPRHLPALARLQNRHPDLTIVIDHAAKPAIRAGQFDDWAAHMERLAVETTVLCKLSGLATEAGAGWSIEALRPYVDHLLATFRSDRLIFGSDWPVSTLATTYHGWIGAVEQLTSGLSSTQRAALFGGTAARIYGLR
jgi:L-fuconolactonase